MYSMALGEIRKRLDEIDASIADSLGKRSTYSVNSGAYIATVYGVNPDVTKFYMESRKKLCKPGEDSSTYKETALIDGELIALIDRRIKHGEDVVKAKLETNPYLLNVTDKRLENGLRDTKREDEVIKRAIGIASGYGIDNDIIADYFRWIMNETTRLEINYVNQNRSRLSLDVKRKLRKLGINL
ncbi:hypothetical protein EPN87_01760 [archaeon]|nr:MAG: hypothetical protein EPN87_01760 [archaeon]